MFGRTLNPLCDYTDTDVSVITEKQNTIALDDWKLHQEKCISLIFPTIYENVLGSKNKMMINLNKHRKQLLPSSLPTGSVVMLKDVTRTNKFEPKYVGPYHIVRRARGGAYVLRDFAGDILDRHVPADQLKILAAKTNPITPSSTTPVYEVEKVIDHKGDPGSYSYLVKWKTFSEDENTWEPQESFFDTNCIQEYWKRIKQTQTNSTTLNNNTSLSS